MRLDETNIISQYKQLKHKPMKKLANDAASMVACALSDYMMNQLDLNAFQKATRQNFPKDIANHIEEVVYRAIFAKENHVEKEKIVINVLITH